MPRTPPATWSGLDDRPARPRASRSPGSSSALTRPRRSSARSAVDLVRTRARRPSVTSPSGGRRPSGTSLCTSGPEVAEAHERLGAGVLERHALLRPLGGDEDLVLGHLAEADVVRAVDVELADRARALGDDQAVGAVVLDRDRAAGEDGQLAGAEELLAVDGAVDDPLVDVPLALAAGVDDRLQVVVGLELGVDVLLPVELVDEVVEVVVLVLGDVLDEQVPGDAAALDHRLVHAEDVGAPLRLVGHERAGGVEDARGDQPAGAGLEAVRLGVVEDAVVALVPALQAACGCRPWWCPARGP